MSKGKGKSAKEPKCTRAFSVVMILAILLSVFVGIVFVENGSQSVKAAEATQNVTDNEELLNLSVSLPSIETKAKNLILLRVREEREKDLTNQKIAEVLETRKALDSGLTPPAMVTPSIGEPSSNLTITILNETTASAEWSAHCPDEYAAYLPIAQGKLKKDAADVEIGIEQLFSQDVQNIQISEGNGSLLITFDLKGNYTNGFVTGKYRYTPELSTYAPVGLNSLKVITPQNKTLVSINPGPNEMEGNEFVYHDYNWVYPVELQYADKGVYRETGAATVGDVWALQELPVISIEVNGTNNYSRFCIPGNWTGCGSDPVPSTDKTAYEVANDYKPWLYNRADQCPDNVYCRVVKGYDPYADFDAYLIQYFGYWRCQDPLDPFTSHEYDYEPIFIWVRNIGEKPYRVAYDRWGGYPPLGDMHVHEIHRTYLWSSYSDAQYDMPSGVYAQHSAYYPFGRVEYTQDLGDDIYLSTLSSSLQNNWDDNHVKLGIATDWHTFDTNISGSYCGDYSLSPLTDDQLIIWYRKALDDKNPCDFCDCDPWEDWEVMNFRYDISDPFYGVFWEDRYGLDHDIPPLSATINSAVANDGILTVNVSARYDNSGAGGFSGQNLTGLWKDRFDAFVGALWLGNPISMTESTAGEYTLEFDVSAVPSGTHDLWLLITDNLDENYCWTDTEVAIEYMFKDDFECYSVGDRIAQIDKWTDAGSYTDDNWVIQTASGHGKVLGVYDPSIEYIMQQIEPQCGDPWTEYTWTCDFRFANNYNIGGEPWAGARLAALIFRWDDNGAYMAIIDMDYSSEEDTTLDQNDPFWVSVWNLYDINGDGTIVGNIQHDYDDPDDEAILLGQKGFTNNANGFAGKLLSQDWFELKVGMEGYYTNVWLDGIHVLATRDTTSYLHPTGNIGQYLCNPHTPHTGTDWQFDNVAVTKGCLFSDQFESETFSNTAWDMSPASDCYVDNGVLVQDYTSSPVQATVSQDFLTRNVAVEGEFNFSDDKTGASYASIQLEQGSDYTYTLKASKDGNTLTLSCFPGNTVQKSCTFDLDDWYKAKIVLNNTEKKMYGYLESMLELQLDLPGDSTSNITELTLESSNAKVNWDNIYVEQTPTDTTPPTVSIISPSLGATVSGIFTVEASVNDSGGSGISHSALYANDPLIALNTTGSDTQTFTLDTCLLDSGNCTLTVVAIDNALNGNWTAITVDVNKLPVANFTYSPENPTTVDTITFNASPSYDPDGNITSYEWDFGDGNTSSGKIVQYSYADNGTYLVNLTVTDDEGAKSSTFELIIAHHPATSFDTGAPANPYPSISGTHNGTIKVTKTVIAANLYTYPCPGTGGHTEYVKIWNSTGWNVTATWNGYQGDWHNISFNESFTLYSDGEYNYTIRTGSYPQIHHTKTLTVPDGEITCTKFTDANGRVYGWILAIRLWSE